MGEVKAEAFDNRQCLAPNLDQMIADKLQAHQLGAAQKLFSDCINTRALQESVQQEQASLSKDRAAFGNVTGFMNAPQMVSIVTDTLQNQVRDRLVDAKFAHPEIADILTGVKIED